MSGVTVIEAFSALDMSHAVIGMCNMDLDRCVWGTERVDHCSTVEMAAAFAFVVLTGSGAALSQ